MGHGKALNVAIVGGGPGCKAIMDMIFVEKLSQLRMKLIGVACTNPKAVGYRYAQEKGIYTTRDYHDLYELEELNIIIEVTGRKEIADEISRTKPNHVRMIGDVAARLFWDIFQVEEKRIAERKRSEEATRVAYAELNQIFETSADGMRVIDKDFNVIRVNGAFSALCGISRDQILGKKCYEVFGGPRCHTSTCPLTQILSGEERVESDSEKKRKDGTTVSCIVTATAFRGPGGELVGIVEDFKDITDRKHAEDALRESEVRFRTQFDLSPQAIAFTEVSAGRLIDVNQNFCELTKYTKEEVLGRTTTECMFYSKEDRAVFLKELQGSGEIRGLEMDFRAKDGSILNTLMFAKLVQITGETLILSIFVDLTDRKRLEVKLQQAQKLEAIGTLAGGIAHDFNNLLMGIQGIVSLMVMDIDSNHPHYERLQKIEKQIQSGARLTSHLLGYARKGKYEVKPVDLNQLLKETSETFGRTRKEIIIPRELSEGLFAIEADPGQIEQVLLNLFVNAADAMPGGGNLNLTTMNITHKDMTGKLYHPKPGDYVLITVADTGIGMDKETMERIFDPFFTTKEMGRGTGLGLASAYGIIKGHGGYIDVDSKKGQGSTFSIYLPASERRAQEAVKTVERLTKGTGTVLLVDDEEVIIEVGKELLKTMGYRVLIAKDGEEAIAIYKKHLDDIDIVVLDMVMPNMGGGEAYDRMKEINPDIKVLLSSGFSIDGEASEILARGCSGFIQKPFTMKELSGRVSKILEK